MPNAIAVTDLISSALRVGGVTASGETPNANEFAESLLVLNDLLENWSTERLSVWSADNETFTTQGGKATYTIGPSGDFNTARPSYVAGAYTIQNGVSFPVSLFQQADYNLVLQKTMQQLIPERLLFINTVPLGSITLWPVPSQAVPLVLSLGRTLVSPTALNTQLIGPPGYTKALRLCLGVELAIEFGMTPSAGLIAAAADAKGDYKRANITTAVSRSDPAITGHY